MLTPFTKNDARQLAELWRRTWIATYPNWPNPDPVSAWENRLLEAYSAGKEILVYGRRPALLAFMIVDPVAAHISQLFVDVPHQRKGIGTAMLDYMKKRFPGGWTLNVIVDNRNAIRFYERYGLAKGKPSISPISFRERMEFFWNRGGAIPA